MESTPRLRVWNASVAVVCAFSVCTCGRGGPQAACAHRPFAMGFTPFPYDMTAEAVKDTAAFVRKHGDVAALHFDNGVPWTEALTGTPFHTALRQDWEGKKALSKQRALFLALTPLDGGRKGLAKYRGAQENMALPAVFAQAALNSPEVKKAYLTYCLKAIAFFKPRWCVIGIEVNELIVNAPRKWPAFCELFTETLRALKEEFPALPLGASFSLHALTDPAKAHRNKQRERVAKFLRFCDFVGLSYYPFMAGNMADFTGPLSWVRRFTEKPLAVSECGFPAETIHLRSFGLTLPSTPSLQERFFSDLLTKASEDRYLFVIAFLHRDYDALWEKIKAFSPEFFIVWKDCGLVDEKGRRRPAYEVWATYLRRRWEPQKPPVRPK